MENAKTLIMAIVIASLFLNIACSNTKAKELEQQLQQKEKDYLSLKNDFQRTQESNDKQYDELISIQSELAKLDSLSHLYRGTINRRESKSLTMKEEIDSLISKIKDDIQKKDVEIQNNSKTENKLRVVIKSLTDQLNVKEQEVNELKGIVSSQRGQISNMGGQVERLEGRERELSQQIIELESKKRELEDNMRLIQGDAYYNIGIALENAELNIPELSGIFVGGVKKDEVIRTKAELRQQVKESYQKAVRYGNQKAINKLQ